MASILSVFWVACDLQTEHTSRPFFDFHNNYVGDSIFVNNVLERIIFADTSYEIDSIVFKRFTEIPHVIQSSHTYKAGKNVFENIEYYSNGRIRRYLFINDKNKNDYYERLYDENGVVEKIVGKPFFVGFIVDTTSESLDVKVGSTIKYLIYHPNPPDCKSELYIKGADQTLHDVFQKADFLNSLHTVYQDNNKPGIYKSEIVFKFNDPRADTAAFFSRSIIFNVVP